MSEQDDTTTTSSTQADGSSGFTPPATQDELNRIITERVTRERQKFADYGELKEKAAQFDQAVEQGKTEAQKAVERAEAAEKRAAETESRALRLEIAAEKGLTPAQAKRLVGSTREELEADASELLDTFKPASAGSDDTTAQVVASLDLGTRGNTTAAAGDPAADFAKFLQRELA